jgi:hypothetical protein
LLTTDKVNISIVGDTYSNRIIAVHISSKEWLTSRSQFDKYTKKNPYFEWISLSNKDPKRVFKEVVVRWRAESLKSWTPEEVLRYFTPNGILKWTKDQGYLYWGFIREYFEDFLKLNPVWKFIGEPSIYVNSDLIVAVWRYDFELDSENWRVVKPAQYLFVLERLKWWKYMNKWWIRLLHSSFVA